MPTFEVHYSFALSVEALPVSNAAVGSWLLGGAWVAGDDHSGFIPQNKVRHVCGATDRIAGELVRAGLWEYDAELDGYWMVPSRLWRLSGRYRRKIPRGIRSRVYERDGHACRRCGARTGLTLDHIFPWSRGGTDDPSNLQTLCGRCNSRKGATI